MKPEEIFDVLRERFGEDIIRRLDTEHGDPWVEVKPESITEVARFCRDDQRLQFDHLNNLCGVDYLEPDPRKAAKAGFEPHLEIVYHLSSYTLRHTITLKVILPRWKDDQPGKLPEVPSVCSVWAIAEWHEREAFDLVGVRFVGHPDLRRILLPVDWVGHPLRKDYEFPLEYHGIRGK
ncbi:MAG: NADH-quinone oxidoreductase subunit C [Planctomycetota bacterium]|nr:MAG: NADH-quinone oxidoreductase subunit C [Planctomycetota bacterium]